MTLAVVLATEAAPGGPDAGPTADLPYDSGTTLLERLLDQFASLNVHDSRIIARREFAATLRGRGFEVIETKDLADDLRVVAELARAARRPLVIVHGDLVASDELLTRLVLDSKAPAAAVISRARSAGLPTRPVVRLGRSRIVSAGSRYHQVTDPNAVFRGVLRVAPPETAALAGVAEELAGLVEALRPVPAIRTTGEPAPEEFERFVDHDVEGDLDAASTAASTPILPTTAPRGDDVPALLLTGLVRAGVRVRGRGVRVLVCERALTAGEAAAARAAVESVDEDRVRLDAAVKSNDGFFTTYAVSSYSWRIARWAARRRLTPNVVTSISMGVAVVAAVWFAAGTRTGMIVGAALLYIAFVLDCVDGQLARYTRQFSTLGAWLDATFDRAKEYVAYAGLAVGSTAAAAASSVHGGDVWRLAVAAMAVQTCRHMVDFAFGAAKRRATGAAPLPALPLDAPDDSALDAPPAAVPGGLDPSPRPRQGLGRMAIWLSNRTERMSGLRWAKKIVILPIGERFALISLSAALFNARVTFVVLLAWGLLAAAYTLTGRILRSLA
ncbi:MAG TPA: CDP-alcohol phosphatidyltransferase family protein [Streptosporangiaceae bacterium]|nr:CDP-alcohol phosphatidyltransferase family protein [Streptosporangiaceae bacterium]